MRKKITVLIVIIIMLFMPITMATEVEINATSAVMIDENVGKVLYEKNAYQKMYPASTTKIMTAIIVLEHCSLDEMVAVSDNAVKSVEYGYVTANLKAGEQFTVEQMLNVLLVASSNDIGVVLAEHIAGSVDGFADLMNEKATEIGCKNTHFTNPSGIHDENHYTTAYDLALIAKYAMQFEEFQNIVCKIYYKLDDARVFSTTNDMLLYSNTSSYKYANGIKTGFTTPAGYCIVTNAEKNGLDLIVVILNSNSSSNRFSDAKKLSEFGFENYYWAEIANQNDTIQTVEVKNATRNTKKMNAVLQYDIDAIVSIGKTGQDIRPEITFIEGLKAPIEKGTIIGEAVYTIEGVTYKSNLLAGSNVEKSHLLLVFFIIFVVIIFALLGIGIISRTKKSKTKNIK